MSPGKVDQIKRSILWLRKTLRITDSATQVPGEIEGRIKPVLDALGWELIKGESENENLSSSGPTTSVSSSKVPAEQGFLVFAAHIVHTDARPTVHSLGFSYKAPDNDQIGYETPHEVEDGTRIALSRPVYLEPGAILVGTSADSVTGALQMRMAFYRLAVGEYVPGSPYG